MLYPKGDIKKKKTHTTEKWSSELLTFSTEHGGGFGEAIGMVPALPQTLPEAPRGSSGRCFFLPASPNLCPCGFRGQLGCTQGLFPVFERAFLQLLPL